MTCIFCHTEINKQSIEHIVPEALGNKFYLLFNEICSNCNNNFSSFEKSAVTSGMLLIERANSGIKTKKGKNAKGVVDNKKLNADSNFRKGVVEIDDDDLDKFIFHDDNTGTSEFRLNRYDGNDVSRSKMLLKIGFESLYKSQNDIFKKYDFKNIKDYLLNKDLADWAFVVYYYKNEKFESIPRFTDKYRLKKIKCSLSYLEFNDEILLFDFQYANFKAIINLINRDFHGLWSIWIMMQLMQVYILSILKARF